jgi:hypothetical protein
MLRDSRPGNADAANAVHVLVPEVGRCPYLDWARQNDLPQNEARQEGERGGVVQGRDKEVQGGSRCVFKAEGKGQGFKVLTKCCSSYY